jgi:flagellar basal-body rod modification protein FlgD
MAVSAAAALAPDTGANANSRTRLSDNYDTFLVLLTAQLQNQDPLAPMDSTQFTQQLVQFSQVEQQIRTNEQLEGLVGHYQAASAGAALSYLGREALIESDTTTLANGAASWGYTLSAAAETVDLTVKDARGRVVYEGAGERGAGSHLFNWDGRDRNGQPVPAGTYRLSATAKGSDDAAIKTTYTVRETISGVDFSGATPLVITASGSHEINLIRAVLDGG